MGLKVVLADIDEKALQASGKVLADEFGEANVLVVKTDVSKLDEVERLRDTVLETLGEVNAFPLRRDGHLIWPFAGERSHEQCGDWETRARVPGPQQLGRRPQCQSLGGACALSV